MDEPEHSRMSRPGGRHKGVSGLGGTRRAACLLLLLDSNRRGWQNNMEGRADGERVSPGRGVTCGR